MLAIVKISEVRQIHIIAISRRITQQLSANILSGIDRRCPSLMRLPNTCCNNKVVVGKSYLALVPIKT